MDLKAHPEIFLLFFAPVTFDFQALLCTSPTSEQTFHYKCGLAPIKIFTFASNCLRLCIPMP